MNALLLSGLFLGLLGANPDGSGYMPGDYADQTYQISAPCGDCCEESCDDCGDEPCGRACGRCCDRPACGPLTFIFSIFRANTWCGPSCGERYWGDFYSDPPCDDPCDRCGNYAGRSYGGEWGSTGGYGSGPTGGGCKNCNKNRVFDDQPIPEESRVIRPSTRVSRSSHPSAIRQTSHTARVPHDVRNASPYNTRTAARSSGNYERHFE
jgi:hypothetical protein